MANKVLALNKNGQMTYCTCPPDMRGIGRCNHIAHQNDGESTEDFVNRCNEITIEAENRGEFIPENAQVTRTVYRMTDEEKANLVKIENRMQLDQNIGGGYIELDEALWNDMDKNEFSRLSGLSRRKIDSVLHGEGFIIIDSNNGRYPTGRVLTQAELDELQQNDLDIEIRIGTGVYGMNAFAEEVYNWQATKDVYVLPYYMRMGVGDISSDITVAYKYLLRNHRDPNKQQIAYEALLNNNALSKDYARYTDGFKNKSLADEFAGKGGVFRACLSGGSIPYSARAVVTPTVDMNYGELKIPPTVAVDIFKPTIIDQLIREGKTEEQIDEYFAQFRVPQTEVKQAAREDLERRISGRRVLMNRQPSLHTSSFQSYRPKISENASCQVHPLYCEGYNMDFDGDQVSIYGINADYMIPVVDEEMGADVDINTHVPRATEKSAILPKKDSLWGLLNILDKRSK